MMRRLTAFAAAAALVLVAGCTTSTPSAPSSTHAMPGMPGMTESMPAGDGLSRSQSGFSLVPTTTTVTANTAGPLTFRITGPDQKPVTQFVPEQTKLLHGYVIRSDLTGFAHLHPTLASDGTWTVALPPMAPGDWRAYAQFTARSASGEVPLVLSTAVTVPGQAVTAPVPPPTDMASVDGYTIKVAGHATAGQHSPLTLDFSNNGQPVTDLQPYLETYAHVTAIRAGTLAFAHLHPGNPVSGDHGGPRLSIDSDFPASGDWRLFIEFQTAGTVRTAEMTIHVA